MKFRIINILLGLFLLIAPCVAFGLTGKTPEEDDCANKYNTFYKSRDKLYELVSEYNRNQNGEYDCWIIDCAELDLTYIANHYMLTGPFATLANNLARLIPFPEGNNVPFWQSRAPTDLESAYQALVAGGATSAEAILNGIKESTSISDAFRKALKALLPPNFDAVAKAVQDEIDLNEKIKCLNDEKQKASTRQASREKQWTDEWNTYENAISAIKDGDTACDADFYDFHEPSKPDYSCTSTHKPAGGECRLCDEDPQH